MPLEHALVTEDEEFYQVVPFMFEAIHPIGFVEAYWPDNLTKEGQQRYAGGFFAHKKMDPTVVWTKVIDSDKGKIIGVAQWLVYRDQKPPQLQWDGVVRQCCGIVRRYCGVENESWKEAYVQEIRCWTGIHYIHAN